MLMTVVAAFCHVASSVVLGDTAMPLTQMFFSSGVPQTWRLEQQ
jgi:hypothetical protein